MTKAPKVKPSAAGRAPRSAGPRANKPKASPQPATKDQQTDTQTPPEFEQPDNATVAVQVAMPETEDGGATTPSTAEPGLGAADATTAPAPAPAAPEKRTQPGGTGPPDQREKRYNEAKLDCPSGPEVCEVRDIMRIAIGNGAFETRIVKVIAPNVAEILPFLPLKHTDNHCLHINRLLPDGLTCRVCGRLSSNQFNAYSHVICQRKHYRCVVCDIGCTTLAGFQKHCRTTQTHQHLQEQWRIVKHIPTHPAAYGVPALGAGDMAGYPYAGYYPMMPGMPQPGADPNLPDAQPVQPGSAPPTQSLSTQYPNFVNSYAGWNPAFAAGARPPYPPVPGHPAAPFGQQPPAAEDAPAQSLSTLGDLAHYALSLAQEPGHEDAREAKPSLGATAGDPKSGESDSEEEIIQGHISAPHEFAVPAVPVAASAPAREPAASSKSSSKLETSESDDRGPTMTLSKEVDFVKPWVEYTNSDSAPPALSAVDKTAGSKK